MYMASGQGGEPTPGESSHSVQFGSVQFVVELSSEKSSMTHPTTRPEPEIRRRTAAGHLDTFARVRGSSRQLSLVRASGRCRCRQTAEQDPGESCTLGRLVVTQRSGSHALATELFQSILTNRGCHLRRTTVGEVGISIRRPRNIRDNWSVILPGTASPGHTRRA